MPKFIRAIQSWLSSLARQLPEVRTRVRQSDLRKTLIRPRVFAVFALVALWNLLVSGGKYLNFELGPTHTVLNALLSTARELRDVNLDLQMRLYQPITVRAIPLKDDHVRLVYIDDAVHWREMYGTTPTDRRKLAGLIINASQHGASVIGVDIDLPNPPAGDDPKRTETVATLCHSDTKKATSPHATHDGDFARSGPDGPGKTPDQCKDCPPDLSQLSDNDALLAAIQFASNQNVTVVLGSYLYHTEAEAESAPWHELENLYLPDKLNPIGCTPPRCSGYGYVDLPDDRRRVPLVAEVVDGAGQKHNVDSFAYKIAKADKNSNDAKDLLLDPTDDRPRREVFGTFLSEDEFKRQAIGYYDLAYNRKETLEACRNKVVLIGGRWREEQGYGKPVDQHLSPAGEISGVALHATYIEALLARQTSHEWSLTTNLLLDVALGLLIFYAFARIEKRRETAGRSSTLAVLSLLGGMIAPLAIAWLSMGLFNKYLDFLFPVELYFLHIMVEMLEHRLRHKHHAPDQSIAGGPAV